MHNYSARPWMAIGIFLLLWCSLFYFRTPVANGPLDIIPLWIMVLFFSFVAFFLASFVVDHLMVFPSKFLIHEIYQTARRRQPSNPSISASTPVISMPISDASKSSPLPEDTDYPLFPNDDAVSTSSSSPAVFSSASTSSSSSSSSASGNSSSSSSTLRPRRDANQYVMY